MVKHNLKVAIAVVSAATVLLTHNLAWRALLIGVATALFLTHQKLAAFRERFFLMDMPEAT